MQLACVYSNVDGSMNKLDAISMPDNNSNCPIKTRNDVTTPRNAITSANVPSRACVVIKDFTAPFIDVLVFRFKHERIKNWPKFNYTLCPRFCLRYHQQTGTSHLSRISYVFQDYCPYLQIIPRRLQIWIQRSSRARYKLLGRPPHFPQIFMKTIESICH